MRTGTEGTFVNAVKEFNVIRVFEQRLRSQLLGGKATIQWKIWHAASRLKACRLRTTQNELVCNIIYLAIPN